MANSYFGDLGPPAGSFNPSQLNGGNEVRDLVAMFEGAGPKLTKALKPIFRKATQNVKNDWQENLRGSQWFKQIAKDISYDDLSTDSKIHFELGTSPSPKKGDGAGGLVHISLGYVGYTARGGGHRIDPIEFLEAESERLETEVAKALTGLFS